ncbi:glycoside hydrolase family 13 protein [Flammeovirga sp. EKP202]|uniref:glycoside hydrolase family 13 protein n=1 Tax=Flammeovirga sp. EKP202 TaxID=2770592 RepID=UPI00165F1598|nr:glycoside hydrolase family 13 protein [Flammeovirga sp. EKP202]MBD0403699.1 glycoside hydrolase family 13 protein [Flammeovirga sp. EKP202]
MKKKNILLTLFMCISLLQFTHAKGKVLIDRVEPAFWWAGMVNPELQVLVHGENITDLTPSLSYEGVTVEQIIRVENPNYLFLNLKLDEEVKAGKFPIEFKRKGKVVFTYDYELKARKEHSAQREGFSNKDIMYLITPDRFANSIPENDHIEGMYEDTDRSDSGKRHGGDLQGIIDNLDYIQDLGFTSIWICPVLESNQVDYSYHGYAITDYYKVDPRYGSNEDYLKLVEEANKRGIKIIMDQVENHAGLNHWWTKDLPTNDWYHHADKEVKPYTNHNRFALADPYSTESEKKAFSDGWFVDRMPDLNQENPLMAKYLIQNSIWWIEYAGLQGIRQDTFSYPDADFISDWSRSIMEEYPNFNIVGEEWTVNPAIVARWQVGQNNRDGYKCYMPSMMDFPNQHSFVESLTQSPDEEWKDSFRGAYEMLSNDFLYTDAFNLVTFMDNHDMARIYDQVNQNYDLYKMAMVYLYTLRGIPQVYYGTEITMSFPENPGDHGGLRIDMPGGWEGDKVNVFKGEGLDEQQKDALKFIKTLTHYRKNTPALQDGKLVHFYPQEQIYVIFRYDDNKTVMSIFNKNTEDKEVKLERFFEVIEGATSAKNILTGENIDLSSGVIKVDGTSALMLEVK